MNLNCHMWHIYDIDQFNNLISTCYKNKEQNKVIAQICNSFDILTIEYKQDYVVVSKLLMNLFVPNASNPKKAWKQIRELIKVLFPKWEPTNKKIYSITDCNEITYTVGEIDNDSNELVYAIFKFSPTPENSCYLVCTESQGIDKGIPIVIGDIDLSNLIVFCD